MTTSWVRVPCWASCERLCVVCLSFCLQGRGVGMQCSGHGPALPHPALWSGRHQGSRQNGTSHKKTPCPELKPDPQLNTACDLLLTPEPEAGCSCLFRAEMD